MKPVFALAAAMLSGSMPCCAQRIPSRLKWEGRNVRWWHENGTPESWLQGAANIENMLVTAQQRHGMPAMMRNRNFIGWMLHLRWLKLFPADWEGHPFFGEAANRRAYVALACEEKLPALFLAALAPEDDERKPLEILCRIYMLSADTCREYGALAIAHAVVLDQPPPRSWPHEFVVAADVPVGKEPPEKRFAFYVDSQRRHRLILDPRRLSVRELTFVVDSVVGLDELTYAQKLRISSPRTLKSVYPTIEYDRKRMQHDMDTHSWPHGTYRLGDILKNGGICADRAYFAVQAGKAKGVPTVFFNGQGRSGTHIWIGYLERPGRWVLDVARYGDGDYPVGLALDPQTGRRLTDAQMQLMTENLGSTREWKEAHLILQWARMNEDKSFYREAVILARRAMPGAIRPWELEAAWLAANKVPAAERRKFWEAWIKNFRENRDLKVRGQMSLLRVLQETADERDAEKLRKQIIAENRSSRFDLGIKMASGEVFQELQSHRWREAEEEFESVMRRFRQKAGGHLFYSIVQPYITTCIQERQTGLAAKASGHLRHFTARKGSMLDNDINRLRVRLAAAVRERRGRR